MLSARGLVRGLGSGARFERPPEIGRCERAEQLARQRPFDVIEHAVQIERRRHSHADVVFLSG